MHAEGVWWRRRYDLWAPGYDLVVRHATEAARRRSLELLALRPGERVLVLGGGTGLDLPLMPAGCHVTLVDISHGMLTKARPRASATTPPADCVLGDAMRLPFADGSFDAVLMHLILAVVPDADAAAREAARVMRPGGRGAVFDKFLPDGAARPSLARRAVNLLARPLATDVTRRLGSILDAGGFETTHREPSLFSGVFQIATIRRRA